METPSITSTTSLSNLALALDLKLGAGAWVRLQTETIMLEIESSDALMMEKIRVIQHMRRNGILESLKTPEFAIWATQVCNNFPAEFEDVILPTSLELAWFVTQVQAMMTQIGTSGDWPDEFKDLTAYILVEDGFSEKVPPFQYVNEESLSPGQLPADTLLKRRGIQIYVDQMRKLG